MSLRARRRDAVLGACFGVPLARRARVREDTLQTPLRLGQVTAAEQRVRPPDPTEQLGVAVARHRRELSRFRICHLGFVEPVQFTVHAGQAQPHGDRIGGRQLHSSHLHQRPQHIQRLVEAQRVFEIMAVRQQRRRNHAPVVQPVGIGSARGDAVHVCAFGRGGAQLAAKAVRGDPLIVEGIGSDRLPVGGEQVHQPQRQESPLAQPRFQRGRRRLRRDPLQEDRVGKGIELQPRNRHFPGALRCWGL